MSDVWKDAFDSVHGEEELKSHTKEYLRRKVYGPRKNRRPLYGGIAMAALCLMMAVFFGGYHLYTTPAAYIHMDGSVSVALSINRFGQVVEAGGYDSDGSLLSGLDDVVHLDYEEAVTRIIKTKMSEENGTADTVTLTVSGPDEALCRKILNTVSEETEEERQSEDTMENPQSVDTADVFRESDGESIQTPQGHHGEGQEHNHRYGQ